MTRIKEYNGKSGAVIVERYEPQETGGNTEYRVRHLGCAVCGAYWTKMKSEAIAHAQFLCRY